MAPTGILVGSSSRASGATSRRAAPVVTSRARARRGRRPRRGRRRGRSRGRGHGGATPKAMDIYVFAAAARRPGAGGALVNPPPRVSAAARRSRGGGDLYPCQSITSLETARTHLCPWGRPSGLRHGPGRAWESWSADLRTREPDVRCLPVHRCRYNLVHPLAPFLLLMGASCTVEPQCKTCSSHGGDLCCLFFRCGLLNAPATNCF